MEDIQNDAGPKSQGNGEGSAKGGAKLMRAGGEDRGGQNPTPGPSRDGDKQAGGSSPAPAAPVLRAGRRALEGAQAAGREAVEGAEELRREAAEGAEAAATVVDRADDGGGADVLREWVSCSKRAYIRNTRALGELFYCRTPYGLLRWQSNLLNETLSDLADTNTRILRLVSHKAELVGR